MAEMGRLPTGMQRRATGRWESGAAPEAWTATPDRSRVGVEAKGRLRGWTCAGSTTAELGARGERRRRGWTAGGSRGKVEPELGGFGRELRQRGRWPWQEQRRASGQSTAAMGGCGQPGGHGVRTRSRRCLLLLAAGDAGPGRMRATLGRRLNERVERRWGGARRQEGKLGEMVEHGRLRRRGRSEGDELGRGGAGPQRRRSRGGRRRTRTGREVGGGRRGRGEK